MVFDVLNDAYKRLKGLTFRHGFAFPFEYSYLENGLYAVRKHGSDVYCLVKASNPDVACEKAMREFLPFIPGESMFRVIYAPEKNGSGNKRHFVRMARVNKENFFHLAYDGEFGRTIYATFEEAQKMKDKLNAPTRDNVE